MARYKVVVVNIGYESYTTEQEILKSVDAAVVAAPKDCITEDEVIQVARDADAVLVREAPLSARVLDELVRCKAIVRYGVGVDNIDLEFARKKRIYVANIPGYGTEEVSDHAVAMLLACGRNLITRDRTLRDGKFETDIQENIYRTTGKTLGLIGYGKIAQAVHRKWRGFLPARVLIYSTHTPDDQLPEDATKVALDTLLRDSDYVSVHIPLRRDTKYLIDEPALRKMKSTAILVNTARGEIIDEAALVMALQEGWILAAGLDVFENEPLENDNPLVGLSNVVLSGHVGWYSKDSVQELQTRGAKEILRILSGQHPQQWLNPW